MTRRMLLAFSGVVAAVIALAGIPGPSTATFTQATTNVATVGAAVDWTPPTVTLQDPGTPLKDTVALTAAASDGETGVASVSIDYLAPNGSSWVSVCTVTTAPYTCSWNTRSVTDGSYDLRARASDRAGYTSTSPTLRTTVANNLLVVLGDPGEVVRGTVSLPTTLYNAGTTAYTVRVEYAPAGATNWKTVCANLSHPYNCSWTTTTFSNDYFDLRAVAVAGNTTTTSAVVTDVLVDNQAPVVTMVDPGTPLSGTRTFAATASDAHSGLAQVVIQYAAQGTSTYKTLCTLTADPFSCKYDTKTLADGSYAFRAVATDVAGNTTTSAAVSNRVVDNTVASVSMDDPGAHIRGTVSLSAVASSGAGIASVKIQYAVSGTGSWVDVCTDTTAPYGCSWDTTKVADGPYDLRAILLDGQGRTTISAVESSRRVDNSPLRAVDVQAVNGGTTVGRIDNGDTLTLTYSEQVDLTTITTGWNGDSIPVTLRLRDGNLLGQGNKGDTVDVLRNGAAVNLGAVNLKEDYVKSNKTVQFNATLSASTTVVNGVARTTVTVRVGTQVGGGGLRTVTSAAAIMVWSPSATARDLAGNPCAIAPVSESGTPDRDF